MMKILAGVFVGVFVGALAYEVLKKSPFTRKAARKVSEGVHAARKAFDEGYHQAGEEQPEESLSLSVG